MDSTDKFVGDNRELWDLRVPFHANSSWYPVEEFLQGENCVDLIETSLLGDVSGQKILHLQCHLGLTTLSLGRQGAVVTGVDFSQRAMDFASELAIRSNVSARFVCQDVLKLDIGETFDTIFTSWGVLSWLPHLDVWAEKVVSHLADGGRFIVVDGHPIIGVWDFNQKTQQFNARDTYFSSFLPRTSERAVSYVGECPPSNIPQHNWNHSIASIVSSIAKSGLHIEKMQEFPMLPWRPLAFMVPHPWPRFWRIAGDPIPLSFSIVARKLKTNS